MDHSISVEKVDSVEDLEDEPSDQVQRQSIVAVGFD